MKYRKLGTTNLQVSEIGMGTIQITRLPWSDSIKVVREVAELGINWFDTAQGYLDSELRLGEAFRDIRNDVILITKSGSNESDKFREHVEASLQRLQTDYIDVLFFHGAGVVESEKFAEPGGVLETAERFVEKGLVRYLGFSAHKPEIALKALDFEQLKVSMVPANYINREYIDFEFMEKAIAKNVAVIAMKPFGGGRITAIEPSLRFLKTYPELLPCIGIEKTDEMRENIETWDSARSFSDEDDAVLRKQRDLLGDRFCRLCGYCLPCPEEIPIPTVNFLKVFSMQMPREKVVIDKHAEAVEKVNACTECRQCVRRCPYDLDIPEMIKENAAFYREFARQLPRD
jgi:uncharacterized protein